MTTKKLLYIDDTKIDTQIDNLRRKLKNQGITLEVAFIHLNEKFMIKESKSGLMCLDKNKIQNEINEKYMNINFDVVASDFDFRDNQYDGFQLLKWIKNESDAQKHKLRKAKFCLYSAEQDKVVSNFNTPELVKKLIKLKIDDFIDRSRLAEELMQLFILQEKKYNFKYHLISYLERFGEERFKSIYPKFENCKLSEIALQIEKDLPNGIEFQKFFVELTISHLIELNDFPVYD